MNVSAEPSKRTEKTACILCSRNCGLQVEIEGNKFGRIIGDDDHPFSKGYLCQKAARLEHYQNHDDRLQYPLERQSDGSFARVSWDEALTKIAQRLLEIREKHGGDAFAFVGGGGQGNHLGGAYGSQILAAMKSRFAYNSLAQEKTGDFWLNGRLFGHQTCHTTEDVEHADYVLFIGTNPFQAHGIANARDTLRDLRQDAKRTMVVIDPRRTETAKIADVHLQLRPGTDAFLLSAMLSIIVREGLYDREFIRRHCTGFDAIERALREIPVEDYVARADVPLADVERVARGFAQARSACVRIDLGLQHTLHTTLNGYLEKLLYLITGNFGRRGGNNLHSSLVPILGHTDEREKKKGKPLKRTAHHGMHPISGIYPPNILPDEIEHEGENRVRAVFVDSVNPLLSYADTGAYERAFKKLELLVVVDVTMNETTRLAHFILPAASQFEKWEATGFNLEFPENYFHLRHPLFSPLGESLPEPEIYTRLLEKMGVIPTSFLVLEKLAGLESENSAHLGYLGAFALTLAKNKRLFPFAASILYRTFGKTLPKEAAAAAPFFPLAVQYAQKHRDAVKRAGIQGNSLTLGANLFRAIMERRSGLIMSRHEFKDMWRFIRHEDGRVHLEIPEMLEDLQALRHEELPGRDYPFILVAGERRAYNANTIYRNPAWRKVDPHGAMRMHPEDAKTLGIQSGKRAICTSARGEIEVVVEIDDTVRRGMVTLPHGYGMRYKDSGPLGPEINRLTSSDHCDPRTRTPYHKYVPVRLRVAEKTDSSATSNV
jgi:anaerobic selenocysteine-containing dehydrogenase